MNNENPHLRFGLEGEQGSRSRWFVPSSVCCSPGKSLSPFHHDRHRSAASFTYIYIATFHSVFFPYNGLFSRSVRAELVNECLIGANTVNVHESMSVYTVSGCI